MLDGLKPYPEYKDSDLPWLTRAPAHWQEFRLDRLFDLRQETPLPEDDRVTGYLNGRVTLRSNVQGQKIKGVIKDGGWIRVHPGDFAISGMNAHLGGMGVSDSLGKCSPIYLVLKPKQRTNAYFVSHYLRHVAHVGALKSYVNTIRYNSADFKRDALKLFRISMPNTIEQTVIVRFLDHSNRQLEKAIRGKRKTITLLNEQKQVIIHRAVTRGLDPNVPLKDSGIPWLGSIPAHWEIRRCKYLFREVDTRSEHGLEQHLSMSQRLGLVPSHLVENRTLVSENYAGGKLCILGDLVLNRLKAHLGVFAIAHYDGVISPDYTVLRPVEPRGCAYFEYLLRSPSCRGELRIRAKGIVEGFWRLYTDDFYDIRLPMPPLEEQIAIIEHDQVATTEIVNAVDRLEREISLLREYRTRLIADVVTGKLDVREAAASLPDVTEDARVLDAETEESFVVDPEEGLAMGEDAGS